MGSGFFIPPSPPSSWKLKCPAPAGLLGIMAAELSGESLAGRSPKHGGWAPPLLFPARTPNDPPRIPLLADPAAALRCLRNLTVDPARAPLEKGLPPLG